MTAAPSRHPICVCLSKDGDARFLGHLDFLRLVDRSVRRSGLPVAWTQGFHPRPKISFADALPLGLASEGEWINLTLLNHLDPDTIRERLEPALPECTRLVDVRLGSPPPLSPFARWRAGIESHPGSAIDTLAAFLERETAPVPHPRRDGETIDARAMLADGRVVDGALELDLVRSDGKTPRPGPVVNALAGLATELGRAPPVLGPMTRLRDELCRQGETTWPADAVRLARVPLPNASC